MLWFLLSAFVITVLAISFIARNSSEFSYRKKNSLFSQAEISFFGVLNIALAQDYLILSKVRVADILAPQKGLKRELWQLAFNRIASQHFDFVLCDKQSFMPVAVIELDESRVLTRRIESRRSLIKAVCNSAKIPLVRFPAEPAYEIDSVINQVDDALNNIGEINTAQTQPVSH